MSTKSAIQSLRSRSTNETTRRQGVLDQSFSRSLRIWTMAVDNVLIVLCEPHTRRFASYSLNVGRVGIGACAVMLLPPQDGGSHRARFSQRYLFDLGVQAQLE